jgi:predicted N-acyltransferase
MPDGSEPLTIEVHSAITEIDAGQWDACAGDDPFTRHSFLSALEDSGSVTAENGWLPQHLSLSDSDGRLIAAAPLYLKNHSYGEYVFDWGWADAYERADGRYYPKLQCAVPFTPVTGRRLLVTGDVTAGRKAELEAGLAAGMIQLAERHNVSSLHITFPTEPEWWNLGELGLLQRTGQQFHWRNDGYPDFDAFLDSLASRKRKQIRKERRVVAEAGLDVLTLTGGDLEERHWDAFYRFYRDTSERKWGSSYLTREFFSLLGERAADDVVLFMVEDAGRPVAGALNLKSSDTIFGRNWGCDAHYKFLHFETCYYRAIDYAIAHGLSWVEAGAQGPHKVQRGYLPRLTYSAHWIADPGFRDAVARFLTDERQGVEREILFMSEHSPFRQSDVD